MNNIETVRDGGVCTPLGFSAGVTSANIKGNNSGRNDFAIIASDSPATVAAVFTKNIVQAAPIIYSKNILRESSEIYSIVVNSGNANACTGEDGVEDCKRICLEVSSQLDIPLESVLIASTGVIGSKLPMDRIMPKLGELIENLDEDNSSDFAKAIMTSDSVHKEFSVVVTTDKGTYCIGGACKGAGMIDPSMATMLCFITTDAIMDDAKLQYALNKSVDSTFNRITVDGDMSTNDSVFLLANGMSDIYLKSDSEIAVFIDALTILCKELSHMIVKDGEGATKFVTIEVKSASNELEARLCASKIANSPLVKTMFAGCDPNWGRLMSSAGASGAIFDPNKVAILFDNLLFVKDGKLIDPSLEKRVADIMKRDSYKITIDLGAGNSSFEYYTCDMTEKYISINADYRS